MLERWSQFLVTKTEQAGLDILPYEEEVVIRNLEFGRSLRCRTQNVYSKLLPWYRKFLGLNEASCIQWVNDFLKLIKSMTETWELKDKVKLNPFYWENFRCSMVAPQNCLETFRHPLCLHRFSA